MSADVVINTPTICTDNQDINDNVEINLSDRLELEVYIEPREYKIVGDDVYIPINFDDAPPWLTNTITNLTNISTEEVVTNLNELVLELTYAVSEVELAKNRYEQSITDYETVDSKLLALLTTMNSSMDGLDASLKELIATKVTHDEASVVALDSISTAMNDTSTGSTLGSAILNLQTSITNLNTSTNTSIESLESSINGAVDASATALDTINTYVGIDETGTSTGTGILADVAILQKQNDGIIETMSGTYDVILNPQDTSLAQLVLTAEPYATWRALDITGIDVRLAHIGDVYVKYSVATNGAKEYIASYKFIRAEIDSTSPYATDVDGFTWAVIIDQASQDTYTLALDAYELADGKRRVFTSVPFMPIDEGDLWITGTEPQVIKTYKDGSWELADTQLSNFVTTTYNPNITQLQNQIDGKVESWFTTSTSNPKDAWLDATTRAKHDGDMWYQTDTKISYYYSSMTDSWNVISDTVAITALTNAATAQLSANNAQSTADSKITTYYIETITALTALSTTWTATEKLNNTGDLAIVYNDTEDNNTTWRWNGSTWITVRDKKILALASAITSLSTDLSSGTGTWATADSNLVNSLTTVINDGDANIESKFEYNSTVNINGTYKKSGFGLTTNYTSGSGTLVDPYVSEFWVDASSFKVYDSLTGAATIISGGKINADLIEMKTEENGYVFTIDQTGIKIVKDGVLRLLIGKIS